MNEVSRTSRFIYQSCLLRFSQTYRIGNIFPVSIFGKNVNNEFLGSGILGKIHGCVQRFTPFTQFFDKAAVFIIVKENCIDAIIHETIHGLELDSRRGERNFPVFSINFRVDHRNNQLACSNP